MTLAQTRGNVWSDPATVDATVSKVLRQKELQARLPDLESRIQVGVGSKIWMPDLESRIQVGDGYRIWVQAFGYDSFLSLLSPLSIDVQVLEGMEGEGGHLQYVEAGRLCHDVLAYMASEDPCVQVGGWGGEGGGGG